MSTEVRQPDVVEWDPERSDTWDSRRAWRTLWITTYTLSLGFATWFLVSAIAPRLVDTGFTLSTGQLYWLVAVPGVSAGLLRLVFMFLPPVLGSRTLVAFGAALLLIPLIGWTVIVRDPSTPYAVLLAFAFATGIGGGIFSGLMASTSYYFPKRLAGTALGLQAGLSNFGVPLVQVLAPWSFGFGLFAVGALAPEQTNDGSALWIHNGGLILIPWVVLAVVAAFLGIRRVPITANFRQQLDIFRLKHTWIMTVIYVMSFGVYSGLAAQTGLMIKQIYGADQFGAAAPNPVVFAFVGPALGALIRTLCGPLCDRYGGGRFTLAGAIGMTIGMAVTLWFATPTRVEEFRGFFVGLLIIFVASGFANAGTFKQMPMIFTRRQAGGAIGWTAAIGAFGPFLIGSALTAISPSALLGGCLVFCALCTVLVWHYYVRPHAEMPS